MEKKAKIKKAVIIAGYECNNNCRFCLNSDKRNFPGKDKRQIMEEIAMLKKKGFAYLEIIGGEATIRPDIIDLISFAKKLKFKYIAMATNGRLFAYKEFSKKMVEAGLTDLIFSIHGHNARLHDYLTGVPGSFKQLLAGVENIKKLGMKISTNTTIVKQNFRYLPQIGKLLLKLGSSNAEFIFVDPTHGAVREKFFDFVPKISIASPYIKKCLDLGRKKNIFWRARYVPLCYFHEYFKQISELHEVKVFHTHHLAPDFVNYDVAKGRMEISRIKTDKCKGCAVFQLCEGIWKEYVKHYGDKELEPILKI